jgi:hypothetical protein
MPKCRAPLLAMKTCDEYLCFPTNNNTAAEVGSKKKSVTIFVKHRRGSFCALKMATTTASFPVTGHQHLLLCSLFWKDACHAIIRSELCTLRFDRFEGANRRRNLSVLCSWQATLVNAKIPPPPKVGDGNWGKTVVKSLQEGIGVI